MQIARWSKAKTVKEEVKKLFEMGLRLADYNYGVPKPRDKEQADRVSFGKISLGLVRIG